MGRVQWMVAVVTGAGSGIGAATAELLAEEGASVVCSDRDADACGAVSARIAATGGRAIAVPADVADAEDVERLVGESIDSFSRVDILHNNAGIGASGAAATVSSEDWDRCLEASLRGTWLVSRAVVPHMLAAGRGAIVNTCSGGAPVDAADAAASHAAIAGIRSLTVSMARVYAPTIRVNSVSPGMIDTGVATARGVANAVLFLASPEASLITAHDLVMSGGPDGSRLETAGTCESPRAPEREER